MRLVTTQRKPQRPHTYAATLTKGWYFAGMIGKVNLYIATTEMKYYDQ